jgi:hypothetical protein
MQTNRLSFVDVDTSASLPQPSAITGFAVIKAPKGTTKPQYVQKGNTNSILNLFGAPSATFPGLQEVIDFNQGYGLWISAPGGNIAGKSNYSYYGGTWLTARGSTEPFHHITEDSEGLPAMETAMTLLDASNESSPYTEGVVTAYTSTTVLIDNIPDFALATAQTSNLYLTFPRAVGYGTANIEMTITATEVHAINPTGGADLTIGTVETGSLPSTKKIVITGSSDYAITGYKDLDFESVDTKVWYAVSGTNETLDTYLSQSGGNWFGSNAKFTWEYDISDDVLMAIHQSSPRQTAGVLTVSKVDIAQATYGQYTASYALSGTTDITAGAIVYLMGKAVTVTSGMSNTQLVTLLAAQTIPGYTLGTANAGASLTVTNIGPSYPAAQESDLMFGLVTGITSVFSTLGIGTAVTNPNYNTIEFRYTELAYPGSTYGKLFKVSTDINKTDSAGNNIYAETTLAGNEFLGVKVFGQLYDTIDGYTWATQANTLIGSRAVLHSSFDPATELATVLQAGWDKAGDELYNDTKIFFEPECVSSLATTLANYRNTQYPFSTFITGIKVANGPTSSPSEVAAAVQAIVSARSGYPNLTGLAYYCNEFRVTENYSGSTYWTIPTGAVASMLAKIMEDRLGGAAPMFVNENQLGGQISKSVKKQKYSFDAGSLDILDAAGVNPIILDTMYGLMITSQKTAQSPMALSDWSFLGHSMAFDLFRDEMKRSVMIPQIGKLIDPFHLSLRKDQTNVILRKRLQGATAIWAQGVAYVNEVNTPDTLMQNKFVIKVRVKVSPFSEYVELIFNNVNQNTFIE